MGSGTLFPGVEVPVCARRVSDDELEHRRGVDLVGAADVGGEPSVAQPGARASVAGAEAALHADALGDPVPGGGVYLRGLALAHLGLEPFSEKERWAVHQCLTENALSRDVHRQRFRDAWSL